MTSLPSPGAPGVYCLVDLDGRTAYVGQSGDMRRRINEHLQRRTSTIAGTGRLDVWDIECVHWWTIPRSSKELREAAEEALIHAREPYLNSEVVEIPTEPPIDPETPDGVYAPYSDDELEFRNNPYNRMNHKITHIDRIIDNIRFVDNYEQIEQALEVHIRILNESLEEFLYYQRRDHDIALYGREDRSLDDFVDSS